MSQETAEMHYLRARADYISSFSSPDAPLPNPIVMTSYSMQPLHSQKSQLSAPPSFHHSVDGIYESAARLLYLSVTWARNVPAFLQLPFRDQIILLEESWRELFIIFAIQWSLPFDSNFLVSPFVSHKKPTDPDRVAKISMELRRFQELATKFRALKVTEEEFIFLKAIILFKYGKSCSVLKVFLNINTDSLQWTNSVQFLLSWQNETTIVWKNGPNHFQLIFTFLIMKLNFP